MDPSLFEAAKSGNISKFRKILNESEVDINCQNDNGQTPLMIAVKYNHLPLIKYMISKGANSKIIDNKGLTAFDYQKQEESTPKKIKKESKSNDESISTSSNESSKLDDLLAELNNLVGLDNIKEDIKSLINMININELREKENLPVLKINLHSVFIGSPGTGKTTIARLLAKIYYALGVLPSDNFIETDRSGLVAGYVGQTAIKTDKVINDSLDGVLFIDEAYSLKRSEDDNDYGIEAIDTLLKRMEDYRDRFIVIVAGYENEMNTFINSNPGLKSRFNRYFYFKDYNPNELTEIYNRLSKKSGFILTQPAKEKITSLFSEKHKSKESNFSNARLVRNIYEKTFENHANRTALANNITKDVLTTITEEDIPKF